MDSVNMAAGLLPDLPTALNRGPSPADKASADQDKGDCFGG